MSNEKSETKNCQNCKSDFTIEPNDFSFYEKIKVPPPTFCPECRQARRYAWRNERVLYRRNCNLCSKSIVTIYSPNKPFKVYCPSCWWSDSWDAKDFAQNFDFSRTFFEQWRELQLKVPRIALLTKNSIKSDYTNHCADNKNCYLSFDIFNAENVLYSSNCWDGLKDSCDCSMAVEKGIFLYECVSCDRGYNCQFCFLVHDSINCFYCYDCRNCSDCFLSSNLRNKKYCILNKQYSKEEYQELVQEYELGSFSSRKELYTLWLNLIKNNSIHKFAQIENSINVSGDVIRNSKNCQHAFDSLDSQDSKYLVIAGAKSSMDLYSAGLGDSEFLYEDHALLNSSNVFFTHLSYDNVFMQYCDSCHNSQNLFGCVGIKKGNYVILNKKYSESDFNELKDKIIKHMEITKEYGEFFPSRLSPFGYNETQGMIYMPLTKEDALKMNMNWEDNVPGTYGKETTLPDSLPDSINEIEDVLLNQILSCEMCTKNYNVVPQELEFYRNRIIPIPRRCPDCRYKERILLRPPRKLWHRQCMCNKGSHTHNAKCEVEFETSYAPDRPEIVYCEKCYQQEVY